MVGETVVVETREKVGEDGYRAPIHTTQEVDVRNVLVAPGSSSDRRDAVESNRPEAHLVRYTLHFPKTFDGVLEGLRVKVRGRWCRVVGAPDHYTRDLTPTDWWMPVEVEALDG